VLTCSKAPKAAGSRRRVDYLLEKTTYLSSSHPVRDDDQSCDWMLPFRVEPVTFCGEGPWGLNSSTFVSEFGRWVATPSTSVKDVVVLPPENRDRFGVKLCRYIKIDSNTAWRVRPLCLSVSFYGRLPWEDNLVWLPAHSRFL